MIDEGCVGCTDTGTGKVGYLIVENDRIAIVDLYWIIRKVREMHLSDDEVIEEELIQKVEAKNYVPSRMRKSYTKALLELYKKRL